MQGIFVMAFFAVVLSVAVIGGLVRKISERIDRPYLMFYSVIALIAFFISYHVLRVPMEAFFTEIFSDRGWQMIAALTIVMPLADELAKLIVVSFPMALGAIGRKNYKAFAFSIGLGFGIGEIIYLADVFSLDPIYGAMAWYSLGGFLVERIIMCFMHGTFLLVALSHIISKKPEGIFYAIGIHWLFSTPIYLVDIMGLSGNMIVALFLSFWLFGYSIAMIAICRKIADEDESAI